MDEALAANQQLYYQNMNLDRSVYVPVYHQGCIRVEAEYLRLIHIESHKNSNFCMP